MDEAIAESAFTEVDTVTGKRIGEPAACLLDEHHRRGMIPGLPGWVDHRLDSALGQA